MFYLFYVQPCIVQVLLTKQHSLQCQLTLIQVFWILFITLTLFIPNIFFNSRQSAVLLPLPKLTSFIRGGVWATISFLSFAKKYLNSVLQTVSQCLIQAQPLPDFYYLFVFELQVTRQFKVIETTDYNTKIKSYVRQSQDLRPTVKFI